MHTTFLLAAVALAVVVPRSSSLFAPLRGLPTAYPAVAETDTISDFKFYSGSGSGSGSIVSVTVAVTASPSPGLDLEPDSFLKDQGARVGVRDGGNAGEGASSSPHFTYVSPSTDDSPFASIDNNGDGDDDDDDSDPDFDLNLSIQTQTHTNAAIGASTPTTLSPASLGSCGALRSTAVAAFTDGMGEVMRASRTSLSTSKSTSISASSTFINTSRSTSKRTSTRTSGTSTRTRSRTSTLSTAPTPTTSSASGSAPASLPTLPFLPSLLTQIPDKWPYTAYGMGRQPATATWTVTATGGEGEESAVAVGEVRAEVQWWARPLVREGRGGDGEGEGQGWRKTFLVPAEMGTGTGTGRVSGDG